MSNRYAEVVVLAEDERSANLLRRYVQRALHLHNRRIRQEVSPSAQGDAKQWVLGRYPIEVASLRRKHPKVGLVVHLDADTEPVGTRVAQLANALRRHGIDPREQGERISHVVPRRQTETWLCVLTGLSVDEERDCKRERLLEDFDRAVASAASGLYDATRANAPAPLLSSLASAIPELRRLET